MTDCALCSAKDAQITRLLSRLDTIDHARAKARVVELEEMLARSNSAQPSRAAVEVARQVAAMDPRTNDGPQECFFCCSPATDHRADCAWKSAVQITKAAAKRAG